MTVFQELIAEFEDIKNKKCESLKEVVFFTGVLSIIESKYISKEKEQIENAHMAGQRNAGIDPSFHSALSYYKDISTTSSLTGEELNYKP